MDLHFIQSSAVNLGTGPNEARGSTLQCAHALSQLPRAVLVPELVLLVPPGLVSVIKYLILGWNMTVQGKSCSL